MHFAGRNQDQYGTGLRATFRDTVVIRVVTMESDPWQNKV
jgi:hypothetical protein